MKKYSHALIALVGAIILASPVQAKKKSPTEAPPTEQQQSSGPEQPSAPPSYQPFPTIEILSLQRSTANPLLLKFGLILMQQAMHAAFLDAKTGQQCL